MSRYEWASDRSEMAYADSKLGTDTVGILLLFARFREMATDHCHQHAGHRQLVPGKTRGQSTRATAMPMRSR